MDIKPRRCFDWFNVDREKHKEVTAIHEAGHAVITWVHGIRLKSVAIGKHGGFSDREETTLETVDRLGDIQGRVVSLEIILAGGCAQRIHQPCVELYGCEGDETQACNVIGNLNEKAPHFLNVECLQSPQEFLAAIRYRTDFKLKHHWGRVQALASALLENNTLDGEAATQVIVNARPFSPDV